MIRKPSAMPTAMGIRKFRSESAKHSSAAERRKTKKKARENKLVRDTKHQKPKKARSKQTFLRIYTVPHTMLQLK